ncbi:hypothetical protein [Mycolicibacterium confluentis]|uniref:Uncharacterized protein n=1 Tax=Mycolicibacterium confluentis TaxID=28047 RepID=A0A7I7Y1D3_9MYCO|nr:hypothetical protein [Mycolicibacterium confluentis]MCV7320387.1 FUSC family protein [Mycolicibacterium confluentis]ORV21888.1 hypothetical protein AWB99_05985 [Mycolicibacterium confluentis]BBZ35426.1 hypothetical protein MCNF_40310 [Mycolicibacterium confluentis]
MTGPENGANGTRPISVAELLAKNGTIGAPPVGGRRRRRRGNSDAVTVAELTGEIPIIRTGEIPVVREDEPDDTADADEAAERAPEAAAETATEEAPTPRRSARRVPSRPDPARGRVNGTAPAPRPVADEPVRERRTPLERSGDPLPRRGRPGTPERSHYPRPVRSGEAVPLGGRRPDGASAETMSPDPIDLKDVETELDLTADTESADAGLIPDEFGIGDPSFADADDHTLFGGETVADDLARRRSSAPDDDDAVAELDGFDEDDEDIERDLDEPMTRRQLVAHGASIALQSIIAVAFGAGLFIAFDQLWKWNSLVALALGVLIILGLVVGVRIVRKTEDIGSTLTAVAVGALVTFGPLALLQAN